MTNKEIDKVQEYREKHKNCAYCQFFNEKPYHDYEGICTARRVNVEFPRLKAIFCPLYEPELR